MNKKEIAELKKRFTKTHTSISRMAGCYVNAEHEKVCSFAGGFADLPEDEFFKYLEIASKTLSGTKDNNLLDLAFPAEEEAEGGSQELLYRLSRSKLKDESLLDAWYDRVIEHYKRVGNYLILLFSDSYDVPMKSSDGALLDESEETYTYALCAVCPVELSKPGLGYVEADNCFAACSRSWVVGAPESGLLFPAFTDRSTDIHHALFYTKDTKEPHGEFMTDILGCEAEMTASENRETFKHVMRRVLGSEEKADDQILDIQKNLADMRSLNETPEDPEPYRLTASVLESALTNSRIPENDASRILKDVKDAFGEKEPAVGSVVDSRALKSNEYRVERNTLREELVETRKELKAVKQAAADYGVVLTLSEEKADAVTSRFIDGERYLLIPLEEEECIFLNGEEQDV